MVEMTSMGVKRKLLFVTALLAVLTVVVRKFDSWTKPPIESEGA
jgi:hypothetical protein